MRRNVPDIPGLPDRFSLRRQIAQTAYGDVIEAIDRDRNHTAVALKLLHADGSRADIARAMFKREVEALKGLSHPAIVQILDSFECDENLLCIELELIPGGRSLSHLFEDVQIGRRDRPPADWRVRMAVSLTDAVIEAHRRSVIHRDIKPGNVLWNRDDDSLKLADFGIAAVLPLMVREPAGTTLRSFYTRPFASPEQLLQKASSPASDVYGLALLITSLFALEEPDEDFTLEQLPSLLDPITEELRRQYVEELELTDFSEAVVRSLDADPKTRPSLTELREILLRVQRSLVVRPQAAMALTNNARDGLSRVGFVTDASITDDLNCDLRVRLDRGERGERIKLFGRSLFAVVVTDEAGPNGEIEVVAVDAGQNPGPQHEANRRSAVACPVRLRLGRGPSSELVAFAREADSESTKRATTEIVERARLIVDIERERLPVFVIAAEVHGGQRTRGREQRIGRASGYTGASTEMVDVAGGYRLQVTEARVVPAALMQNVVRSRLRGQVADVDEPSLFDDAPEADWYTLFDKPNDIDVLDDHGHIVGKVTRYDRSTNTVHIRTDRKRRLPKVGQFFVRNQQKERQLRQQEMAIDAVSRGETARADMPHLLAESAVHRMGENPWVDLLQSGLIPARRVRHLVNRILASETVFCLQGPPGTGKTTIIAEVVAQILELEPRSRILVCAQANDAVANAIERVLELRATLSKEWIVVRDVRFERARVEGAWSGYEAAYQHFAKRVRTGAKRALAETSSDASREAIDVWVRAVEHRSRQVGRDHWGLVQVWGTTTARATRPLEDLDGETYDLVVVDEAAKATVGEVLVPVVHARRLLFVGDQKQLPPFLEDTTAQALQELGISEAEAKYSLFEHLYSLVPKDHRDILNVQFRMHPSIGDVVSKLFYDEKLTNGPGTTERPLPPGDFSRPHRVMWLDVVGRDYKVGRTSRANDAERAIIARVLDKLEHDADTDNMSLNVAVIAAYRGQADKLRADLHDAPARWKRLTVKAATVDAFQGREADVVIYSLVRTGAGERRFIADGRRFNVALSRARSLLVIVGDRNGARGTARLTQLLDMIPDANQIPADEFAPPPTDPERLAAALGAKFKRPRNPKK